jgi:hypothetical protein
MLPDFPLMSLELTRHTLTKADLVRVIPLIHDSLPLDVKLSALRKHLEELVPVQGLQLLESWCSVYTEYLKQASQISFDPASLAERFVLQFGLTVMPQRKMEIRL